MIISPERNIYLKLLTTPSVARTVGFDVYPIAVPKIGATLPFIIYRPTLNALNWADFSPDGEHPDSLLGDVL